MTKCNHGIDPRKWKDQPPKDGVIRTVCTMCGGWVGNRYVQSSKQPKEPKAR